MKRLDLTGKTFNSGVIVTAPAGISKHGKSLWKCICFCKKEFIALGAELLSGHTKSCGCYSRSGTFTKIHSHRSMEGSNKQSEIYTMWINIRERCSNPNNPRFEDYGGRGISYPESWDSFETFIKDIENSIGPKPPIIEGYERYWSIDRINNDKSYSVDNIRWATPTEQRLNQRNATTYRRIGKEAMLKSLLSVSC